MADIEFDCPHCGSELVVDDVAAGIEVTCPHCAGVVRIPERKQGDASGGAPGLEVAEGEPSGVEVEGAERTSLEKDIGEEVDGGMREALGPVEPTATGETESEVEGAASLPGEGRRGGGRHLDDGKLARAVRAGAMQRTDPGELFIDFGKLARKGMLAFLCPACAVPMWIKRSQEGEAVQCAGCGADILSPDSATGREAIVLTQGSGVGTKIDALPPRREGSSGAMRDVKREEKDVQESEADVGIEREAEAESHEEREEQAGSAVGSEEVSGSKRIWVGPSRELQFTSLEDLEARREVKDGWEDDDRGAGSDEGGTEKLSRGAQRIGILFFVGVVAALGYFVWSGGGGDDRGSEPGSSRGEGVLETEDEVAQDILANFDEFEKVLGGFYSATSPEEMARYVRKPQRTLQLMREYYADEPLEPSDFQLTGSVNFEIDRNTGDIFYFLDVTLDGGIEHRGVVLEREGTSYKIDWESYVGYSEMPWATFLETRPSFPLLFRVKVAPDNYFNYQFSDEEKYVCLRLTDLNGLDTCFGYVERGSPEEERINVILARNRKLGVGEGHFILQLQWLPDTGNEKQVLIAQVVRENWLLR
ncbi:MAG: hypothetical protein AAGD22_02545 [Verrucomicrobiota bacterium]